MGRALSPVQRARLLRALCRHHSDAEVTIPKTQFTAAAFSTPLTGPASPIL